MLETNEILETQINIMKEKEKKEIEEMANKDDKKYFDWIDELLS